MFTVREHTSQSTSNVIVAADSPLHCLLDYIQSDGRFSALSFQDSLDEQGVIVDEDALVPLLAIDPDCARTNVASEPRPVALLS